MINFFLKHRFLIYQLSKREILSRYKGSILGVLWSLLTPIVMLLIFTFVFGSVFQAKWPGRESLSQIDFSLSLFMGLTVFWFFAEILSRAPTVFSSTPNFIKKVVFPLEVLPVSYLLAASFQLVIHMAILFFALILFDYQFSWKILSVIPLLIAMMPLSLGLLLILGSLGVYLKDLGAVVNLLVTGMMFLSPIFYPVSAVPQSMEWIFYINPLTVIIENMRGILMFQENFDWLYWSVYFICSMTLLYIGYLIFKILRKGFSDVM